MNIKIILFLSLIVLLHGCSLQKPSLNLNDIKKDQTLIVGNVSIITFEYLSGKLQKETIRSLGSTEIAIKKFNKIDDIPNKFLGYSGVTRILSNDDGSIIYPIEGNKYFMVHLSSIPNHETFFYSRSKARGNKTIEFNPVSNKANYFGHIIITTGKEKYDDINNDGKITRNEFQSRFSTYDDFYSKFKGYFQSEETLSDLIFTDIYSIEIRDEYDTHPQKHLLMKNLATIKEFK